VDLLHLARTALGALSAAHRHRTATATPDGLAMGAHEAAGTIEPRLTVAKILGTETRARGVACATRSRRSNAAASAHFGTTSRTGAGATGPAAGSHRAGTANAGPRPPHGRRSREIVGLLNANDLRSRETGLLARAELRTNWSDHARPGRHIHDRRGFGRLAK
jgi:hypothetical protein